MRLIGTGIRLVIRKEIIPKIYYEDKKGPLRPIEEEERRPKLEEKPKEEEIAIPKIYYEDKKEPEKPIEEEERKPKLEERPEEMPKKERPEEMTKEERPEKMTKEERPEEMPKEEEPKTKVLRRKVMKKGP